ncbi:MAG TPA: Rieske 2Fe-2S domain-containing protein [Ktedonobacteraceae bacterium]|nr:Rieske 2Fe-2S domain-containing protein [Ktedonobacteraceae bacterium]
MAGEDQERFEDYLELERYIEELQAGHVAHVPEGLTPDQARVYRMATLFHAASSGETAPRPEFVAELQAKLDSELQHTKKRLPFFSKKPQTQPRVSRRTLLTTGAAAAVAAASVAMGAGIDHVIEEHRITALVARTSSDPWLNDIVPSNIPSKWLFVTTLDKLGNQAVSFVSEAVTGYVIRNNDDSSDPAKGKVIAMSATCTHKGCIVQWQNTDRKFHCPCHGGLFTEYGQPDNSASAALYLSSLPRLDTNVDAKGNIFVRVPDVSPAATPTIQS